MSQEQLDLTPSEAPKIKKRQRRFLVEKRRILSNVWESVGGFDFLRDARACKDSRETQFRALWTKYRVRRTDLRVL
jgi:hypothetical protein